MELDLKTLEAVKTACDMYSDHSSRTLGYDWVCNRINALRESQNASTSDEALPIGSVGGSAIDADELIEKLEKASEYWRDYDNSRGYQVGLDKARMMVVEMKNGGVKLG